MGRAEVQILRLLKEAGEAYQADIVRATGLSKGTVSEALADLEERKIVRRVHVGRSARIVLTAEKQAGKTLRLGFTRSAEYPFLVELRRTLKQDGIDVQFSVYENGISVARDLSLLRIDIGIAPLVTLFVCHSLDAPIKILGPAGSGGSSVMARPKQGEAQNGNVACTKMSTMEMLMRSAITQHVIPRAKNVVYASSPAEMSTLLMSGAADACCIWEPYATMLEECGARRLVRYSELSEHVCCAFAAGTHISETLLQRMSKHYAASLETFKRDTGAYASSYAALAGLDSQLISRVSKEYAYPVELETGSVVRQLERAGMTLPSPSSFSDAVFHP